MNLIEFIIKVIGVTFFGDLAACFILSLVVLLYRIAHKLDFKEYIKPAVISTCILFILSLMFLKLAIKILI